MGLFSRLFGGKETEQSAEVEPVEYKGFLIYQEAIAEGGQYRIAGRITKEVDGEVSHDRSPDVSGLLGHLTKQQADEESEQRPDDEAGRLGGD